MYLITGIIIFYTISNLSNWLLGLIVYIVLFVIISIIFYKNKLKQLAKISKINRKKIG